MWLTCVHCLYVAHMRCFNVTCLPSCIDNFLHAMQMSGHANTCVRRVSPTWNTWTHMFPHVTHRNSHVPRYKANVCVCLLVLRSHVDISEKARKTHILNFLGFFIHDVTVFELFMSNLLMRGVADAWRRVPAVERAIYCFLTRSNSAARCVTQRRPV